MTINERRRGWQISLENNHYPSGLISEPPSSQHSFLLHDEIARFNGRRAGRGRDIDLFSRTNDPTHQQQHGDDDDDDHDDVDGDDDEKILSAIV